MINPWVELVIGGLLIGVGFGYAWWSKIRIILFRERLFQIRDQLWDDARELGCLDDPSHRQMRKVLNATISVAPYITFRQLLSVVTAKGTESAKAPASENAKFQSKLEATQQDFVNRIFRFIVWHRPVTGILFIATLYIITGTHKVAKNFLKTWSFSGGLSLLEIVVDAERAAQAKDRGWLGWYATRTP